jgi:hypothetical protein
MLLVRITTSKGKIHVFLIEQHCADAMAEAIYGGGDSNLVFVTSEKTYVYPWSAIAEVEVIDHENRKTDAKVQATAKITSGAFSSATI